MSGLVKYFNFKSSRKYLLLLKISVIFIIISCETDNCDLSEYPISPLSEPYAVQYGENWVEYTYVCMYIKYIHIYASI